MDDYIKREDAINLLWLYADESCASVVSDFESLPAVPVVRCRNCRHAWGVSSLPGEMYCRMIGVITPPDGYCHRGEYVRNGSVDRKALGVSRRKLESKMESL